MITFPIHCTRTKELAHNYVYPHMYTVHMLVHCFCPFVYSTSKYRIVGFEVDTKSLSGDSVFVDSRDNPDGVPVAQAKNSVKENTCRVSENPTVLELENGSMLI